MEGENAVEIARAQVVFAVALTPKNSCNNEG
jgi:hypothetical protein